MQRHPALVTAKPASAKKRNPFVVPMQIAARPLVSKMVRLVCNMCRLVPTANVRLFRQQRQTWLATAAMASANNKVRVVWQMPIAESLPVLKMPVLA
jgi:hypothetical protein